MLSLFKPFFFFCAAMLGGFYITGHDVSEIKRKLLEITDDTAKVITAQEDSSDWAA